MKLRKILSLAVVAAVVMTNAVIMTVPTAYAAAEKSGTKYTQGFGRAAADYAATFNGLKGTGWYGADNTQLVTNASDVVYSSGGTNKKFGQIVADPTGMAGNYCLEVCTAGLKTGHVGSYYFKNYGYGTTFPGVEANQNVSGSWEIEFYFIPKDSDPETDGFQNSEFAFTINTSEGPNNLVSCDGTNMILGRYNGFDPTASSIPFSAPAMDKLTLEDATYKVNVFLNIDQGYYSVELRKDTILIARRSPITLNSTNVRFLKFSALGINSVSYVYIDNLKMVSAADPSSTLTEGREKLIFSDDFSTYTGSGNADVAMTSEVTGTSFFPDKYSPWRAYANKTTYGNYSITDGVLRLGKQSGTEKSAMIYAIPGETIVNATTERTRGMLNVSFRINPAEIKNNNGFYVTLGDAPGASTQKTVFTMGPSGNKPKIMYEDRPATVLESDRWYSVNMTIDVINRAIKFVVTDETAEEVVADYVHASTTAAYETPASIGEILFRAGDNSGSYVNLDDVNISYVTPEPVVDTSKIVIKDNLDNTVSGTTNVTLAVGEIIVPLETIANGTTASSFTFTDGSSNAVAFTGTLNDGNNYTFGDTFTITPSALLESDTTYTLTVLTTVADVYGNNLASPAVFTFTTTSAAQDLISINAVKIGGNAVTALNEITAGSTMNVETRYANNTASTISGVAIVAFYGNHKLIQALTSNTTVNAGASGTDTIAFTVPSGINMGAVDTVSVFLWDGFGNITPYCNEVSFR